MEGVSFVDVWEGIQARSEAGGTLGTFRKKQDIRVAGLERQTAKRTGVRAEGDHMGGWEGQAHLVKTLAKCLLEKVNCNLGRFL